MKHNAFELERWQSVHEHHVELNLTESGVNPLLVSELLDLAGQEQNFLNQTHLEYSPAHGSDELREKIAALYPDTSEASVVVTTGGAEANYSASMHLMEPGVPVAVMLPNYMQVPGIVENFGARTLPFYLVRKDGWQPDLNQLKDCLDKGAKLILVTNPNNPTGSILTENSVSEILNLAEQSGAWILADEVYRGAELSGPETPSFWGKTERVIVTNSMSKAYGMPGLRLGWTLSSSEYVESIWSRKDYTTITPNPLSDALACLALDAETRPKVLQRTKNILNNNFEILRSWLDSQNDRFSYLPPGAGAMCYARYNTPINSIAFAEFVRTEKSLLIAPGDHFGVDGYLRLGYGIPADRLEMALGRLKEAFDDVDGRIQAGHPD